MATRLNIIRNLLLTQKKLYVNDLTERFGVSKVTIRKDFTLLEDEGIAERFYGGITLAENAFEDITEDDPDMIRIFLARKACEQIQDGDNIFLGSGRTCCCLAKMLTRFHNLSIVTNNISALGDLLKTDNRLYLIGGEVTSTDGKTLFASPENPNSSTDNIFVSKAFTSISGIDLQAGLTVHSIVSTHIYRSLPSIARSWYLMADHSKFDQIAMYPVADLQQIHYLIADYCPESYSKTIEENNIQVLLCQHEKLSNISVK